MAHPFLDPHLAHGSAHPRVSAASRRYPRLLAAGLLALTAVACGGEVDSTGGSEPDTTGGESPLSLPPPGTGGASTAGGTGGIGAGAFSSLGGFTSSGGTPATGGTAPSGGAGAGGAAPAWDGWTQVRLRQTTECVGLDQPLDLTLVVAETGTEVFVEGTRSAAAPLDTPDCLMSYLSSVCVVPEEVQVVITGVGAMELLSGLSYLPHALCFNDAAVACEMPCDAVSVTIDGAEYGSTSCCGTFDDPTFAVRTVEVVARLMTLIDEASNPSG